MAIRWALIGKRLSCARARYTFSCQTWTLLAWATQLGRRYAPSRTTQMSWAACELIGRPFSVSPADPPNLAGAGVRSCDEQRKLEFEAEPAKQAPPTQSYLGPRQRTIRYALRVLTFGQCRLFQDPGDCCQVPTIPVRHRVGRSPSAKRLRPPSLRPARTVCVGRLTFGGCRVLRLSRTLATAR